MPKRKQPDTSAQIELSSDTQSKFDACYRNARSTQKSIDRVEGKADKGWRAVLFQLAQECKTVAEFKGYCAEASRKVKGDKPRVWVQAQSDITRAWEKHGQDPSDFETLESLRTKANELGKAARLAEKQAEQDKADKVPVKLAIPEAIAAELDAIVRLCAACEGDAMTDAYKKVLADTVYLLTAHRNTAQEGLADLRSHLQEDAA